MHDSCNITLAKEISYLCDYSVLKETLKFLSAEIEFQE